MNSANCMNFVTKIFTGCLFLMIMGHVPSSGQQRTGYMNSSANFNSLIFSVDYTSNSSVMGILNADTRQPSVSPALALYTKWGADLSVIGNLMDNSDDSLENFATELQFFLGYAFRPGKHFTFYPSYSHFFYSRNSNALKSLFSDDIRIDVDYNYDFLSIGASAGYYTGKQHAFYAALSNSFQIYFDRFPFRKSSLSISPGIDVNFGSYEYLNLYYISELKDNPGLYYYLLSYPAIRRYVHRQLVLHPDLTYKDILDTYLEEKAQDSFKLTSVSINLPLYIIIGDFGISLGVYYFIPVAQPDYISGESLFFFNIGLTYNLTL